VFAYGMRWTRLFDDLEAQLIRLEQAERAADVSDRVRSERGHITLLEALAVDCGRTVTMEAQGIGSLRGVLREVGKDWCILESTTAGSARQRAILLPATSLQSVTGLSGFADQRESASRRRFGVRSALRALARDRAMVRVYLTGGGNVQGTIDRIGQDHFDVADHPDDAPRRVAEVRAVHTVPLWAMCALRQV